MRKLRSSSLLGLCVVSVFSLGATASCSDDPGSFPRTSADGGGSGDGASADGANVGPDGGGGDGSTGSDGGSINLASLPTPSAVTGNGHIVFHNPDGKHYRVEAASGATPAAPASSLDGLSAGSDSRITLSPDGLWFGLVTSRFGCGANRCVAVAAHDASYGEAVVFTDGTKLTNIEGRAVPGPGGTRIVYTARGGLHQRDLFITSRTAAGWTKPKLLSGGMTTLYAADPQISADGTKAVFDCGPDPYSQTGTAVCEVGTDGTGFRVVSAPADRPSGRANHHPSLAPDQSVVFEGDWGGERVWRSGGSGLAQVGSFGNDNTPCVLPDGRIASLWLQRPGNPSGYHELKVMNADGTGEIMIVTGIDIVDDGITCGQ